MQVIQVEPKFNHYYFIDSNSEKIRFLGDRVGTNNNVTLIEGDSNIVLLNDIFPKFERRFKKRGLCFLDPYGLHLNWDVVKTAGKLGTLEVFINFLIFDMRRNVFLNNPKTIKNLHNERMNKFWGDNTWFDCVYTKSNDLFNVQTYSKKSESEIVKAYQMRLMSKASFKFVPDPVPMPLGENAPLYYIFFATQNEVASKIVTYLFDKYKKTGSV